jgi:DNA-binding NarL/FixJ family response regulator
MAGLPNDRIRTSADESALHTTADDREARRARVLIADDSESVMREIENLLAPDFDIVGKARNGIDLVEEASRLGPDLIVTDLEMPGLSGIEASRAALHVRPEVPILLLTSHGDRELVYRALNAGIRGYVLKLSAGEELIPAVHGALRGEIFISPALR